MFSNAITHSLPRPCLDGGAQGTAPSCPTQRLCLGPGTLRALGSLLRKSEVGNLPLRSAAEPGNPGTPQGTSELCARQQQAALGGGAAGETEALAV